MNAPPADRPSTIALPAVPSQVVLLETTDPYENLAFEDLLFDAYRSVNTAFRASFRDSPSSTRHNPATSPVDPEIGRSLGLEPGKPLLLLWRNRDAVVFGRNQNPWTECDVAAARAEGVDLVRRLSGGGCVYHDMGNLNYSLFEPGSLAGREAGASLVVGALRLLGVESRVRDGNRAAVYIGDRKVSGSAFRITSAASYSHGTILVAADLGKLHRVLRVPEREFHAGGTPSERAPVLNLRDLDPGIGMADVMAALTQTFRGADGGVGLSVASPPGAVCGIYDVWLSARSVIQAAVEKRASELSADGWVFGKTPEFTHRMTVPEASLSVTVRGGLIGKAEYSCSGRRAEEITEEANRGLRGTPYRGESVRGILESLSRAVPVSILAKISEEIP